MRLLVSGLVACAVLVAAHVAARSTESALVALGGVFVAAQLIGPVLVDWRRIAAAREAPSAHRVTLDRRRGAGAVAWVRLDINPGRHLWRAPTLAQAPRPSWRRRPSLMLALAALARLRSSVQTPPAPEPYLWRSPTLARATKPIPMRGDDATMHVALSARRTS